MAVGRQLEASIRRSRSICAWNIAPVFMLSRGMGDARPRRISQVKLAATLVRQMVYGGHFEALSAEDVDAKVFMPLGAAAAGQLTWMMPDIPGLTLCAPTLSALINSLHEPLANHCRIVAVVADEAWRVDSGLEETARALMAYDPMLEIRLVKEIGKRFRDQPPPGTNGRIIDRLVVEERPGKGMVLNFGEAAFTQFNRRFQTMLTAHAPAAKEAARDLIPQAAPGGWGLAALAMNSSGVGLADGRLNLATCEVVLPGSKRDLDFGLQVAKAAVAWLGSSTPLTLNKLKKVYVCVPLLALNATIVNALREVSREERLPMAFSDLICGWQPQLTFLEFLGRAETPALYIHMEVETEATMAVIWS